MLHNHFFVDNFNISFQSYQPIPWKCNDKIWEAKGRGQEKQIPATRQSIIKIMFLIKFQEFFKKMYSCSGAFRLKVYI